MLCKGSFASFACRNLLAPADDLQFPSGRTIISRRCSSCALGFPKTQLPGVLIQEIWKALLFVQILCIFDVLHSKTAYPRLCR